MKTGPKPRSLLERFSAKYEPIPETGKVNKGRQYHPIWENGRRVG